jgi:hypothetical protein
MSGLTEPAPPVATTDDTATRSASEGSVLVYSCSRLGRVANPPGFSFSTWFRSARRR